MKKIGLIGGMSWASTVEYYRIINELVEKELGGFHSAELILYSVDFAPIELYQRTNQWDQAAEVLRDAAQSLERAGADMILLCGNTMHKIADAVQNAVHIPFIHIVDVTAEAIIEKNLKKVALLGTQFTMEQDFFRNRLESHGLEVVIPEEEDRKTIHNIIYDELCKGIILEQSKQKYLEIIDRLKEKEIEGIILGCTEIGLLIQQEDTPIPLFNTVDAHASSAVKLALES